MSPIIGDTVMRTSNRPRARYGIASDRPYAGGVDEIQAEEGSDAVAFTPPPHGEGIVPRVGVTHRAT